MTRPTPLRSSLRKRKKPDQETETDPGGTSVKSEKQRTVRSSTDDDRSAIKVDLKQDVVVLEDEADFSPKSTKKVRKMVIVESDVEEEKMKPEPESNTKIDSKKSGKKKKKPEEESECRFIGEPIPLEEARRKWPERYIKSSKKASARPTNGGEDDVVLMARCHYLQAEIENCIYNLKDDAYVKAVEGKADYIGRIVEIFETVDGQKYFTAQWFFRAEDTAIKFHTELHDVKRVFLSNDKNDNPLNCIVKKIKIVRVASNLDLIAKAESIPPCDLYYDMSYSIEYTTFAKLPAGEDRSESSSTISSEDVAHGSQVKSPSDCEDSSSSIKPEASLLDLYSGCGAMSTGLCLGARLSGLNLQTRWAVDLNPYACESLKLNHPHTEVRNEMAEDFLALLREWEKLCHSFSVIGTESSWPLGSDLNDDDDKDLSVVPPGEFEVEKIIGICYGDPSKIRKTGIKFKVRWKGYGPSEDTWEPIDGLSKCQERIEDFVKRGYKSRILPLPGDVDVICGGPPCQGISGFNRFRNSKAPLEDPKNRQMLVFMDIVNFLKPKYVLMENVVDILKFAEGYLGRYAISRLVSMNYQTRLGMMVAGCYGLPQFRMRVFLWGARPNEILPQFPLPTHDVVVRGGVPNEFEQNMVAYDEHQPRQLVKALLLGDAISDLPQVMNNESRDEMPYGAPPKTIFQRHIRSSRVELGFQTDSWKNKLPVGKLFDHRPLQLNNDDYQRVCQIPKKKGANFRDLPGVRVGADKVVEWDPSIERVYLPSGKPLVPDYAMSFIKGKSLKPFARLWWDETVPTVVTRAEPHNQAIIHPEQDRVLTIRENARLQGFPDFYKFSGPIKERYIQVGNAVAVPVSTALGYALAQAFHGIDSDQAVFTLPPKFPSFETYTEAVETDDNIV